MLDLMGNCADPAIGAHDLKSNKREVYVIEVKYCEDTRHGHQLQASSKQKETLCRRLKARKVTLDVKSSPPTICTILKNLALIHKGSTRQP